MDNLDAQRKAVSLETEGLIKVIKNHGWELGKRAECIDEPTLEYGNQLTPLRLLSLRKDLQELEIKIDRLSNLLEEQRDYE